ncbi:MAG: molecular chaperone DnaJ [Deltaproteobacteria bacterium]|nr:molecular chaperone DnaJ [Deltaproteobacteria bacterium]
MSKPDYYEVLGVGRDADDETIKKAYRKKALENHPDRNAGDKAAESRFKVASEAFEVLSNAEKRATYDRYGHEGLEGSGFHGFTGGGVEDIFARFGDIFGDFFGGMGGFGRGGAGAGGRRGRHRPRAGEDIGFRMALTFEEAVRGAKKEIRVPRHVPCDACGGKGSKNGTATCPTCRGEGQVVRGGGPFIISTTCGTCGGAGEVLRDRCATCRGTGKRAEEDKLTVTIPAGVSNDVQLRLEGKGDLGENGGPPGDLYLQFDVKRHKVFERHDDDLHCEVKVNVAEAALGAEVDVPTLDGPEAVRLPAGTQSGQTVRLVGKGVPAVRGRPAGDVVAHVTVEIPAKLTEKQRELFEALGTTFKGRDVKDTKEPKETKEKKKGFFEKLMGE